MSREQIRQAFKSAVATIYSGAVHTSRVTDNRDSQEWVNIYLEEVVTGRNFSGVQSEAELAIKFSKQNATDSQLDAVASQIEAAILSNEGISTLVRNPLLQRIEYSTEEGEVPAIALIYKLIF